MRGDNPGDDVGDPVQFHLEDSPRTPPVTDALNVLHPAELAWIAERPKARTGSSTRRPSWLDSPAVDEFLSRSEVYRAVVASRHLTLEHLRQIPAEEILSRHEPEVAGRPEDPAGPLRAQHRSVEGTRRCHEYDEEKISFGELLESLDGTPARAQTS
ncbi:hypothetical protein ACFVJ4_38840 [Streptomyces sp. NPDC127178]|uniref:hypothetical protein n=1 Tax=unclassified Streptomyces TaxID=2593676 RepID=UPI003641663B